MIEHDYDGYDLILAAGVDYSVAWEGSRLWSLVWQDHFKHVSFCWTASDQARAVWSSPRLIETEIWQGLWKQPARVQFKKEGENKPEVMSFLMTTFPSLSPRYLSCGFHCSYKSKTSQMLDRFQLPRIVPSGYLCTSHERARQFQTLNVAVAQYTPYSSQPSQYSSVWSYFLFSSITIIEEKEKAMLVTHFEIKMTWLAAWI